MKKILLFILLLLIPFSVKAVSGAGNDESWELTDGVLTVEPVSSLRNSTAYGENGTWRRYTSEIKKIIIKEFDQITYRSFQNLPELEEVVLPESMAAQIGDYAFYNCPKLKKINIPTSLIRIGHNAFGNTSIREVELSVFTDWVEDDAFPPETIITKQTEEDLIAAGTAGPLRAFTTYGPENRYEGLESNNTCYSKFIGSQFFYDDTAFWKLYNDGTLIVWGTDLTEGYTSSRNPWGCYKKQIKKVIYNADKTGTLTKEDQLNPDKKLANTVYAVYSNRPVEEIMNNRIKEIRGSQFWDCREDCQQTTYYINSVIINRGVEFVDDIMSVTQPNGIMVDRDVYINKYVKSVKALRLFTVSNLDSHSTTLHIEVSPDDYLNNDYLYVVIPNAALSTDYNNPISIIENGEFMTDINFGFSGYRGRIVNDIDEYYISINDNLAPKEIEVDGKTLYLYETYRTNASGEAKLSLPDMQEDLEFYLKEITPPEGYELDPVAYKIDMSKKNIDLTVQDLSIEDALSQLATNPDEPTQDNPLTGDFIMILGTLFILSFLLIIYNYKKGRKLI